MISNRYKQKITEPSTTRCRRGIAFDIISVIMLLICILVNFIHLKFPLDILAYINKIAIPVISCSIASLVFAIIGRCIAKNKFNKITLPLIIVCTSLLLLSLYSQWFFSSLLGGFVAS